MLATTRELANKHNLTYRQTRYLIDQGVINPKPAKEGQAWEVSDLDLWVLEAAAILRNLKVAPKAIRAFTNMLNIYVKEFGKVSNKDSFSLVFFGDNYGDAVTAQWIAKPEGGEWIIKTGKEAIQSLPYIDSDKAVEVLDQE